MDALEQPLTVEAVEHLQDVTLEELTRSLATLPRGKHVYMAAMAYYRNYLIAS